jgi:predicted ArsR family transcriptional regulator
MAAPVNEEADATVMVALTIGTATTASIARQLGVTDSAAKARLLRLEREGYVSAITCPVTGRVVGWKVAR